MLEKKLLDKEVVSQPDVVLAAEKQDQSSKDVLVEVGKENAAESINVSAEKTATSEKNVAAPAPVAVNQTVSAPAVEVKSELRQAVERVMEADLKDLYLTMSPQERKLFKTKGELAAKEITGLIEKTKINLDKILKLLFDWLKVLPGVNRFFIEQEAKLKADQLLKLPK